MVIGNCEETMAAVLVLLTALTAVSGVSVKLSDPPSSTKCYYLDTANGECSDPSDPACQNQTRKCDDSQGMMQACSAVWQNTSDHGFVMLNQGCWSNTNDCILGSPCVSTRFLDDNNNILFCCCFGDLCNGEVIYQPLPEPRPGLMTTESVPGTTPMSNDYLVTVIIYSLVPITVLAVVIVILYWMCRRHRYTIRAMVPLQSTEPSPLTTPLTPTPNDHQFQPVQLIEIRARGRFGAVWKAEMNGAYVAVKVFPLQDRQSWISEQEIYSLPDMKHENVLQFMGTEKRGEGLDTTFWLVTEYHPLGSLYDYLKANLVTWNGLCSIARTMCHGLSFIHEPHGSKPPIAHRDFKSKNVLLKNDSTACIADFGLAIKFDPGKKLSGHHGQVGTRRYMAPEVLEGTIQFNQDAFMRLDMYACGLVLWELVSRCSAQDGPVGEYRLPFEEEIGQAPSLEEMIEAVVESRTRPAFQITWLKHPGLSSICETIEECWDHEAEARLTAGCVEARISHLLRTSQQIISMNNTNLISSTTPLITELSSDSIHKESSF